MTTALTRDTEILRPLVDRSVALAARPEEEVKKKLWADHQALRATPRSPVSVHWEGIPSKQWECMLGADYVRCEDPLARAIEAQLRRRVWAIENIPDDHIAWPSVQVAWPCSQAQDWGVDMNWTHSGDELGARAYDPPFKDGIDVSRLTQPRYEFDDTAGAVLMEKARELTGGKLTVFPRYPTLGANTFDIATEMRGMESLLFDTAMEPEKVTALMEFILTAAEAHEERREREGRLNFYHHVGTPYQEVGFRVHCAYVADDIAERAPRLSDCWIYISAQTSAGLGPKQFAEFVQPYTARMAKYYTDKTVYFHGCETLNQKIEVIADLPNLRRFHVSPWTDVAIAVEKFQGNMVLEVHDHPGKAFFCDSPDQMRQNIRALFDKAQGHPMDLNISDIHSFSGDPALLIQWAEIARDESERAAQ
jgi:Uroporphyrinogen decarboxylase (URO-D)